MKQQSYSFGYLSENSGIEITDSVDPSRLDKLEFIQVGNVMISIKKGVRPSYITLTYWNTASSTATALWKNHDKRTLPSIDELKEAFELQSAFKEAAGKISEAGGDVDDWGGNVWSLGSGCDYARVFSLDKGKNFEEPKGRSLDKFRFACRANVNL